jgi:hypothetical protein
LIAGLCGATTCRDGGASRIALAGGPRLLLAERLVELAQRVIQALVEHRAALIRSADGTTVPRTVCGALGRLRATR